jgi:hypothetical protein
MLAACARYARGGVERAGECRAEAARSGWGDSPQVAGAAWPAASSAEAHRRGLLLAAPMPRPRRAAHPAVTHRTCAATGELAGPVVMRQVYQSPGERITGTRPPCRALSGLAPPASRAPGDRFKPLRRNDLRDRRRRHGRAQGRFPRDRHRRIRRTGRHGAGGERVGGHHHALRRRQGYSGMDRRRQPRPVHPARGRRQPMARLAATSAWQIR